MAAHLNLNRMRDSRLALLVCVVIYFFTQPIAQSGSFLRLLIDIIGFGLVVTGAVGRIYTTAFLGGHKNKNLITEGPFSKVRNPLYVFSIIGVAGIAFLTARPLIIIIAPALTIWIYHYLVKREEGFLLNEFGEPYQNYLNNVPRFIPNLSLKGSAETITTNPKLLYTAVLDSIWWFVAIPFFMILEHFGK